MPRSLLKSKSTTPKSKIQKTSSCLRISYETGLRLTSSLTWAGRQLHLPLPLRVFLPEELLHQARQGPVVPEARRWQEEGLDPPLDPFLRDRLPRSATSALHCGRDLGLSRAAPRVMEIRVVASRFDWSLHTLALVCHLTFWVVACMPCSSSILEHKVMRTSVAPRGQS